MGCVPLGNHLVAGGSTTDMCASRKSQPSSHAVLHSLHIVRTRPPHVINAPRTLGACVVAEAGRLTGRYITQKWVAHESNAVALTAGSLLS